MCVCVYIYIHTHTHTLVYLPLGLLNMFSNLQQASKWEQVVMYCIFDTYYYSGEANFAKWLFNLFCVALNAVL